MERGSGRDLIVNTGLGRGRVAVPGDRDLINYLVE
jgi:hypothetical protein